jgi:hypothetical protein
VVNAWFPAWALGTASEGISRFADSLFIDSPSQLARILSYLIFVNYAIMQKYAIA